MKVYMGKYKNYLGPYQLAQKVCFWAKKDPAKGYPDYVVRLGELLAHGRSTTDDSFVSMHTTRLARLLDWIDSKRKDRVIYVKIDDYDVWSMQSTLSFIIIPMLKKLKESQHGAPYTDDSDVPEELRSTSAPPKEKEWDIDANHFKRWDWILDEMIWAFEQSTVDSHSIFYDPVTDTLDDTAIRAHGQRMNNGYRLFGRYYQHLWD